MEGAVWAIRLPFPIFPRALPNSFAALSDEALMGRYRDDDADAFEELYRRHKSRLHRFVRRMVPQEADEVFQEVWLAVVNGRARYEPSARFVTYLFTIAHHRSADRLRALQRTPLIEEEEGLQVGDDSAGPLDQVVNAELGAALNRALADLPALQREAFLMQAEGELSLDEIAQATCTSRETVKSRLRYANRRLRAALEEWK